MEVYMQQVFKRPFAIGAAIATMFLLTGHSSAEKEETSFAGKTVLLAFEKTGFKKELMKKMEALLRGDFAMVTVVEHSKKAPIKENPADYDAIFISNSGVNSKVRPWIRSWIENNAEHSRKILLHTTQIRDWKVVISVDAVTSASAKGKVKDLAREYVEIIRERLEAGSSRKGE
jgi:hypothetical protein